eukprot:TRINITY_DN315_c0_g2_i1.p1 TRINITY_DN315_c0_g2~~TRINITY_DN315_c0_g2_i1.p1  ORF type:complete len:247 (-),score=50.60 TRINITY_DN315_c0_g2_i1:239-979(-)
MEQPKHLTLRWVLSNEAFALCFRDFLHDLHSDENLHFWLACEEYKEILQDDASAALRFAEQVKRRFLGVDGTSPSQVNVDDAMRHRVLRLLEAAASDPQSLPLTLFDEIEGWIFQMMEHDSFRKFLSSQKFKDFKEKGSGTSSPPNELKAGKKRSGIMSWLGKKKRPDPPKKSESVMLLQGYVKRQSMSADPNNSSSSHRGSNSSSPQSREKATNEPVMLTFPPSASSTRPAAIHEELQLPYTDSD